MSDNTIAVSGEQSLWASVIQVAIEDAKGNTKGIDGPSALMESKRARLWLTKPNKDFNEVCYLAGLDPVAVRERCQILFSDESEYSIKPKKQTKRRGRQARTLTHAGKTLSITDWAEQLGIAPQTINSRLSKGWTIERALSPNNQKLKKNEPKATRSKSTINHDGISLTIPGWAKRAGISTATIRRRIKCGWPIGLALTRPAISGKSGVASNLGEFLGTGGGPVTQDISKIEFLE